MRKRTKIIISLVAVFCVLVVGVGVTLCFALKPKSKEVPSAAAVITEVTDKIYNSTQSIVSGINSQNSAEETSFTNYSDSYWINAGVQGYISVVNYTSPIIYALEYISKNATIENGYAYGFDYDNVYAGELNYYGWDGIVFFTCKMNENLVTYYMNFQAEDGDTIYNFNLSLSCILNSEGEVEKATINYVMTPGAIAIWVVEYDFTNNNFKGLILESGWSHTEEQGNEIISKYNDGTLDYETAMSYGWETSYVVSSNITDDFSNLSLNCYKLSSTQSSDNVSSLIVKTYYDGTYQNFADNTLYADDSFIDKTNYYLINYAQDAITYGENKGTISSYIDESGILHYTSSSYIDYDDMLLYLSQTKEIIDNYETSENLTYSEYIKNNFNDYIDTFKKIISSAYNYVLSRGSDNYTYSLGTYDSVTTELSPLSSLADSPSGTYGFSVSYNSDIYLYISITIYNGNVTSVALY